MICVLWGILNIVIALLFIRICFKTIKFIRKKIGFLAALIFVIGLLSFVGHSTKNNDADEPNSNQIKTWKFVAIDSVDKNSTYLIDVDMDKSLVSTCHLGIGYAKNKQGFSNIPLNAYSVTSGVVCGTDWKPISIVVNKTTDNNKFEYIVDGIVDWKLLGIIMYAQPKKYKGIVAVK